MSSPTKVLLYPYAESIPDNHGIGRVIHSQYKYLPKYNIEFVQDERAADVIALHTQQYDFSRVDVLHLHGMYWTDEPLSGKYDGWHIRANKEIVKAARRALHITVPSEWVAVPFQREMFIDPVIIGHGIDLDEWKPLPETERLSLPPYAVWGKNRASDVCDPVWALEIANTGFEVVSTFAPKGPTIPQNMRVTGKMTSEQMKEILSRASVYLATTKETFGLQTLESMALGVPVLGFDFGGQRDLIEHKVHGYLAVPGDKKDLLAGLKYIQDNWSVLSRNCIERAKMFSWEKEMKKYAELYEITAEEVKRERRGLRVCAVIPCFNYGKYVGEAIQSVLDQTRKPDEIIVVDDGSTDNTQEVLAGYGDSITVLTKTNGGVATARNLGISSSNSDIIVCLDADDKLDSRYIATLLPEFELDRGLGIAYSGLGLIQGDGNIRSNPWPPSFSWEGLTQLTNPPSSCIHSGAMFRKTLWERAGKYVQAVAPAEDTYLWLLGLSRGFTAKKVVDDPIFHYRAHENSASRTKPYMPFGWVHWLKSKKFPFASPADVQPHVRSFSEPLVTVIIPLGPHHLKSVKHTLESLYWQDFYRWEVIVVNDSGKPVGNDLRKEFPYIRLFTTSGEEGTGRARNIGIEHARSPLCLFLDADDWMEPTMLGEMVRAYNGKYIYTDWVLHKEGEEKPTESGDYYPEKTVEWMLHPVTALISTEQARNILFDENLRALEDFDFFARCAIKGYHGERLPKPLLHINLDQSARTKTIKDFEKLRKKITSKFKGADMSSCCGGNAQALAALQRLNMETAVEPTSPVSDGKVRMQFIGEEKGATSWGRPGITPSGLTYRGGNNAFDKYVDADPRDVQYLVGTGKWARV